MVMFMSLHNLRCRSSNFSCKQTQQIIQLLTSTAMMPLSCAKMVLLLMHLDKSDLTPAPNGLAAGQDDTSASKSRCLCR